jgi:hypothetical protein
MIGRLLCRIGRHRLDQFWFTFAIWEECVRCGKRWYL